MDCKKLLPEIVNAIELLDKIEVKGYNEKDYLSSALVLKGEVLGYIKDKSLEFILGMCAASVRAVQAFNSMDLEDGECRRMLYVAKVNAINVCNEALNQIMELE